MTTRSVLAALLALGLLGGAGCKDKDNLKICVADLMMPPDVGMSLSEVDALAQCLMIGLDFTAGMDPMEDCEAYAADHGGYSHEIAEMACAIVLTPPPDAPPEDDAAPEDAAPA